MKILLGVRVSTEKSPEIKQHPCLLGGNLTNNNPI